MFSWLVHTARLWAKHMALIFSSVALSLLVALIASQWPKVQMYSRWGVYVLMVLGSYTILKQLLTSDGDDEQNQSRGRTSSSTTTPRSPPSPTRLDQDSPSGGKSSTSRSNGSETDSPEQERPREEATPSPESPPRKRLCTSQRCASNSGCTCLSAPCTRKGAYQFQKHLHQS